MNQPAKVLIVDDEKLIRLNLRALLEDLGYRVVEAADGLEGLDAFEREHPDLVLSDLRMPGMDGLSMIARLREKSPETPVIVISGAVAMRDAIDSLRLGVWDYIMKPDTNAKGLTIIIERALEKARLLRENRRYREHLEELVRERTKALRESEARYRRIVDTANEGVWVLGPNMESVSVNDRMAEMLGFTPGEMIGRPFTDCLFEEDIPHHLLQMEERRKGIKGHYERRLRHKDGRTVWTLASASPLLDEQGRFEGSFAMLTDITERKKAEEERNLLQAQLYQSQKMEAIGQLAGGIAHDFNNMLTAIMGYGEIILRKMEEDSPLRHFVEKVLKVTDSAAELANGLLTFSRRQVLHAKPIDLCGVVQDLTDLLGRLLPEDIDFRSKVAEEELVVMADKVQIEQVLVNLVTNARDSMPRGGSLVIEVSPVAINEKFIHAHGFRDPGEYACVAVTDTGHGMDEDTAKRIFEPFFTTKEAGKGTGLGMAIVYGIIQQHNGCIAVSSETGKGTTFRLFLPLVKEGAGEARVILEAGAQSGGTETVLLALNDATSREPNRMILEEAGYRVIEALDGKDALARIMRRGDEVDLVIMDVIMPKLDGKTIYEEIKKNRADMKVLLMSGYTREILAEKGILVEESGFMAKPVRSFELLTKVREVLDRD